MSLRPYQSDAEKAIRKDLKLPGNSLVVMPTASGKSHVIAAAATIVKQPVLILQPTRELLEQNLEKLALVVPKSEIGIYSASFQQKNVKKYTFATIQSVYKKPKLFKHIPLVLIDEAHGLAPRQIDTMYMSFLAGMGNPKVIGLTATAYRIEPSYHWMRREDGISQTVLMTTFKMLNRMRHKKATKNFWKDIIYHIPHKTLLDQGYLSPLEYVHEPLLPYAEIPVNDSDSDFNLEAYTQSIVGREANILRTIAEAQKRFKSVLVFCSTTEQAQNLDTVFQRAFQDSKLVLADTKRSERARIVSDFKAGKIQTIFNVGTLTTGFDHPALDCIVLLRPTRSPLLYMQMLGRLVRIAPGKSCGTVIDLTGTCKAMGRIETFELYKKGNLWDLRTEKHPSWHDRVLFQKAI